jgi:hypothetical protein
MAQSTGKKILYYASGILYGTELYGNSRPNCKWLIINIADDQQRDCLHITGFFYFSCSTRDVVASPTCPRDDWDYDITTSVFIKASKSCHRVHFPFYFVKRHSCSDIVFISLRKI